MRLQKQQYDSLNSTVKALDFSPDRTRSRSRIRRTQTASAEDIARKGVGVGTTSQAKSQKRVDLSAISETQVWN